MAVDLATLSLKLSNAQAIADAKATGAALEEMGVRGETAARKLVAFSNPVTEAVKKQAVTVQQARAAWAASGGDMQRFGQQLQSMVGAQNQVTASLAQVAPVAHAGRLSLGRLGNQFTSLTSQIAGVHPVVGNVVSVLGNFAVGSLLMTGILGATAILAALYATITSGARKAREEQTKLTEALAKRFQPQTGPESETAIEYKGALRQQADLMLRLKRLQGSSDFAAESAGLVTLGSSRGREIDRATESLRIVNQALGRARAGGAGILESVTVGSEDSKHRADAERERVARDREAAEERTRAAKAAWNRELQLREARQLNPVSGAASTAFTATLAVTANRQIEADKKNAREISDVVWNAAMQSAQAIINALNVGGGGRGSQMGQALGSAGGAAAGYLLGQGGGTLGALGGPVGAILGSTLGSLFGSLVGGLFDSGKAAKVFAANMANLKLSMDAFRAEVNRDPLAAALAAEASAHAARRQAIHDATGGGHAQERLDQYAAENALEIRRIAQIYAQFAQQQRYATEDLAVRNMRATGQGDAADRQAFVNQQAREMQSAQDKAMADGQITLAEQVHLLNLTETLSNELLAYNNGLLSTALRNAPTGFFGIEGYLGQFADWRGATGKPFDEGIVRPPFGGGLPTGGGGPITLVFQPNSITVDGQGVVRAVVSRIDQVAAATGGAGSSRAEALELM